MRLVILLIVAMCALTGCDLVVNMPALIQQSAPIYREERSNHGMEWPVCGGDVVVVNQSSYRIAVGRNDFSPNVDIVRPGIPYEHIVVIGYGQYGEMVGGAERTFICSRRTEPQKWVIHDHTLWWQR